MLFPDHEVALVTGAGRGIGRAIAADLAREGAMTVVHYNHSEEAAASLVDEIVGAGGQAMAIAADITDEKQVQRMFRSVTKGVGSPRVVVCNAGIVDDGFAMMMSSRKWSAVMTLDLDATFYCCREAMRVMARDRRGSIVNVASISGIVGSAGQANYSAAKGGVIALTKSLAKEGGGFGIRVNAVAPGFIETDMISSVPRSAIELYASMAPLGRTGTPEDVAPVVTFLASDRARYITGQTVVVDGGMVMT